MEIWPIEGPWAGRLAVCSRPRAGWFLDDDLRHLRDQGYSLIVSALTAEEVVRAELQRVPEACAELGFEFGHFPVGNLQVAPRERAHPQLIAWHGRLAAGDGIAIHCWASVGRGPTLAAALLMLGGLDAETSWARIEEARGRQVPDTLEQRAWAETFLLAGQEEDAAS